MLSFWAAQGSPWVLGDALSKCAQLLFSFDIFAWLLLIAVLRYDVPTIVVWIIGLINPRAFSPPRYGGSWPLVSVIIAGRNPGPSIARTIQSVLDSGYPNVEVLYVDDFSTDGSVAFARSFERCGAVRVFASAQHNGKPANLNVGIAMARGELAFVLDADSEIEYGTLHRLVAYFTDTNVGGVAANIFLRNARANLLTRIQVIEYALNNSMARLWRAGVGLLPILPGAASMFRLSTLRELGGYDNGLGDDTDLTLRLRKCGWRLKFALEARVWTELPATLPQLFRQRTRWARNMVKIRLRKHADLINPLRYGWSNSLVAADNLLFRVALPLYATGAVIYRVFFHDSGEPLILTALYAVMVFLVLCRVLVANDVVHSPPLKYAVLLPLYPFYRVMLRTVEVIAIVRELLRIRLYHPYVPKRIWFAIPYR